MLSLWDQGREEFKVLPGLNVFSFQHYLCSTQPQPGTLSLLAESLVMCFWHDGSFIKSLIHGLSLTPVLLEYELICGEGEGSVIHGPSF